MTLIGFTVKQGSNPDSHLDPGPALAPDALPTELSAVAGTTDRLGRCGLHWLTALVLQLVGEVIGLAEAYLGLEAIVVAAVIVLRLVLLLESV